MSLSGWEPIPGRCGAMPGALGFELSSALTAEPVPIV